jgi:hypothetical protein
MTRFLHLQVRSNHYLPNSVTGAPALLKPGGHLFIVTQQQVPTGRLFAAYGGQSYSAVKAIYTSDMRFVVWHAVTPDGEAAAVTSEQEAAPVEQTPNEQTGRKVTKRGKKKKAGAVRDVVRSPAGGEDEQGAKRTRAHDALDAMTTKKHKKLKRK